MDLYLSKEYYGKGVSITFPATAAQVREKLTELEAEADPSSRGNPTFIRGNGLVWHLENHLHPDGLTTEDGVQKLNQLAAMVDGMDTAEQRLCAGALAAESINDLDDVLRVVSNLDQYTIIQGVTSDKELGGWLVEHGVTEVDFSEQVRPYLDYAGIGAEYHTAHGGAYTAHGYVKRWENIPTLETPRKPTLFLTLDTPKGEHCLALPASDDKLERSKEALGVDEFAQASISAVQYTPADLEELIPLDAISVEEANELALWLQQMEQEDSGLMKYRAVLEVEQPDTFSQAVTIAMDIEDYDLVPEDMDEYGKQVLRRIGADDELLDTIDGYMNFTQLGQDSLAEDGVRRTEFGLVRRLSAPFPSQEEMGQTMC